MRKLKPLLTVVLAVAFSGYLFGQFPGDGFKDGVVGTHHDLSSTGPNAAVGVWTGGDVVCEYCHAPHKLVALATEPPLLWNQDPSTLGPFTPYGSPTFGGTATVRDPSAVAGFASYYSLLCLTCHDGSVSTGDFKFNEDDLLGPAGETLNPPNITTGGLANDHPVDFTYSVALATADGGLQSPTEGAGTAIPYVGTNNLPLFKDASGDVSGRLECASCHNPHNDTNMPFLRVTKTGSAICLNCHGA